MLKKTLAPLAAFAIATLPLGALAQSAAPADETIVGTISAVSDADNIEVNDERGFIDAIHLRRNAVISPPGAALAPGMIVRITGYNGGNVFEARQISISAPPQQPQNRPPFSQAPPPPVRQPDAPLRPVVQAPPDRSALPPRLANAGDLTGTIGSTLDSKDAYVGQTVILSNVGAADGSFNGATLIGAITSVTRAGQGQSAQLEMRFHELRLPDGTHYQVDGTVASMRIATKNNALKEAGGALAGMLAGNAIAKTLFGASGGGIIGAVGGYLIASNNRAEVTVPANTSITVHLQQARRQAQQQQR